jgi:hypothetical protein
MRAWDGRAACRALGGRRTDWRLAGCGMRWMRRSVRAPDAGQTEGGRRAGVRHGGYLARTVRLNQRVVGAPDSVRGEATARRVHRATGQTSSALSGGACAPDTDQMRGKRRCALGNCRARGGLAQNSGRWMSAVRRATNGRRRRGGGSGG